MEKSIPTREQVVTHIAQASISGYLGLFVGSGFSIAVTGREKAPSFEGLLRRAVSDFSVRFDFDSPEEIRGLSYPRMASRLCEILAAADEGVDARAKPKRAIRKLKRTIATICHLKPSPKKRKTYKEAIESTFPSWIITTNYDLLLEDIIDDAYYLLPTQVFTPRPDRLPIYHIHGHIREPSSIIITEEDYIKVMNPMEYRQLKMSILLAESATVMIGYGLGDINVRTAMAWARTISDNDRLQRQAHEGLVVQALYKQKMASSDPYFGPDGAIVVEVNDIAQFLLEIGKERARLVSVVQVNRELIEQVLAEPSQPSVFTQNREFRKALKALSATGILRPQFLINYMEGILDKEWALARSDNGWEHYGTYLESVLDMLSGAEAEKLHPNVMAYLAERLLKVAGYVHTGNNFVVGKSHSATQIWHASKGNLSAKVVGWLRGFAKKHDDIELLLLLKALGEQQE